MTNEAKSANDLEDKHDEVKREAMQSLKDRIKNFSQSARDETCLKLSSEIETEYKRFKNNYDAAEKEEDRFQTILEKACTMYRTETEKVKILLFKNKC